jgi:DNA-3-methyladenine glycosylase
MPLAAGAADGNDSGAMADRFLDYSHDPVTVARSLLGQRLVRVLGGTRLAGRIVEVEAYLGARDRAAHTFGGRRTPRNESMYLPGGHAYVYFTYGMHHCLNVVCGAAEVGVAVLIRAIEPIEGVERMYRLRPGAARPTDLCSGPGRLTRALAIDRSHDGLDLRTSDELFIEADAASTPDARQIARTPRIGVDGAGAWRHRLLRFHVRGSPHVSRGRPAGRAAGARQRARGI